MLNSYLSDPGRYAHDVIMVQNGSARIYIASVMGILHQPARYKLFNIARDQNACSDGAISELVDSSRSPTNVLHPSDVPVGYNNVSIRCKGSYNNNIGSIVITTSVRRDRMELIALRTALLYSYSHSNITIYVDTGHVISEHIDSFTLNESGSDVLSKVPAGSSLSDVAEECVDIIMLRHRDNKSTRIKITDTRNDKYIIGSLQRDAIAMSSGETDYVIHDTGNQRSDNRAERLKESIQQAGVGAIIIVA